MNYYSISTETSIPLRLPPSKRQSTEGHGGWGAQGKGWGFSALLLPHQGKLINWLPRALCVLLPFESWNSHGGLNLSDSCVQISTTLTLRGPQVSRQLFSPICQHLCAEGFRVLAFLPSKFTFCASDFSIALIKHYEQGNRREHLFWFKGPERKFILAMKAWQQAGRVRSWGLMSSITSTEQRELKTGRKTRLWTPKTLPKPTTS